ncbi:Small-conductance mechanosensitive channel, partial [Burkholderia dolosa AU0158]
MRHILLGWLLAAVVSAAHAAASPAAASAASGAAPTLTPQQARQALSVLENPREREQVETTLRAIAAVGALSTPAVAASAAAPASAASGAAAALTTNGLASTLVRQGSRWVADIGGALRQSLHSLLDIDSVDDWWRDTLARADARAALARSLWILIAVLAPAFLAEWLARRLLRRALTTLAARRAGASHDADAEPPAPDRTINAAQPAPPAPASAPAPDAAQTSSQGRGHARRHTTLLHRMPRALVSLVLRAVPLLVFVGVASLATSLVDDAGTPTETALESLIDIYVICRLVTIVSRLFFQPDARQLRLLHIGDAWAAFAQRAISRIAIVVGACSAAVEIAANFGLSDEGHAALVKAVALVAHVMVAAVILRCREPVAARLRAAGSDRPGLRDDRPRACRRVGARIGVRRDGAVVRVGARRAERPPRADRARRPLDRRDDRHADGRDRRARRTRAAVPAPRRRPHARPRPCVPLLPAAAADRVDRDRDRDRRAAAAHVGRADLQRIRGRHDRPSAGIGADHDRDRGDRCARRVGGREHRDRAPPAAVDRRRQLRARRAAAHAAADAALAAVHHDRARRRADRPRRDRRERRAAGRRREHLRRRARDRLAKARAGLHHRHLPADGECDAGRRLGHARRRVGHGRVSVDPHRAAARGRRIAVHDPVQLGDDRQQREPRARQRGREGQHRVRRGHRSRGRDAEGNRRRAARRSGVPRRDPVGFQLLGRRSGRRRGARAGRTDPSAPIPHAG